MTRQARVGLVIGLLFIIAFGAVLSDLTGEKPPAPVPSPEENPNPLEYAWKAMSDAAETTGRQLSAGNRTRPAPPADTRGTSRGTVEVSYSAPEPNRGSVEVQVAEQHRPEPRQQTSPRREQAQPRRQAPGGRVHTVQAGETLIGIARKYYGAENGNRYRLIFQANRDSLPDDATVVVGQKLLIPGTAPAEPAADRTRIARRRRTERSAPRGYREMTPEQLARHFGSARQSDRSRLRYYVIQQGDNLSKISRKFYHNDSPESVRKIIEANELDNPDLLKVGQKLNIPT